MKKLNVNDVGIVFLAGLLVGAFILIAVFSGIMDALILLLIFAVAISMMAAPYAFTWFWNTYIATEDSDGSDEG